MSATGITFRRSIRGYSVKETCEFIARREGEFLAFTERLKEINRQMKREEKILEDRLAGLKQSLGRAEDRHEFHKALSSWLELYFKLAEEAVSWEKKRLEADYRELAQRIGEEETRIVREINGLLEFLLLLRKEGEDLEAKLEEKWKTEGTSIASIESRLAELLPATVSLENCEPIGEEAPSEGIELAAATAPRQKALVADDDPTIRAMLRVILGREGFEVIEAADGQEAERHIDEMDPPAIAVLDIMMPYRDGYQLVEKIRSKKDWNRTAVIMLTANSSEQDTVRLLEAGADDYITKPFNVRELTTRITKLAERVSLEQASDACRLGGDG